MAELVLGLEPVQLKFFGGLLLILLVLVGLAARLGPQEPRPKAAPPFTKPVLSLELPRSADDVKTIVGDDGDERRAVMRAGLVHDSLFFIPGYTFFFLGASWLLSQRTHWHGFVWLGFAAGLCALGAAVCDYVENQHMLALLNAPLAQVRATQSMVDHTRYFSLAKWGLSFVTLLLLSALFLWKRHWYVQAVGVLYLLTALVGLLGLFHNPLLEKALGGILLSIPAIAILLLAAPQKFLDGF